VRKCADRISNYFPYLRVSPCFVVSKFPIHRASENKGKSIFSFYSDENEKVVSLRLMIINFSLFTYAGG